MLIFVFVFEFALMVIFVIIFEFDVICTFQPGACTAPAPPRCSASPCPSPAWCSAPPPRFLSSFFVPPCFFHINHYFSVPWPPNCSCPVRLCPHYTWSAQVQVSLHPKDLKCKLTAFSCSLFDHTNHVFGGPPVAFDSQNTCITYDAVNAAFISARDRVGLPPVRGKFTTHDVGNLGTVIHEASR